MDEEQFVDQFVFVGVGEKVVDDYLVKVQVCGEFYYFVVDCFGGSGFVQLGDVVEEKVGVVGYGVGIFGFFCMIFGLLVKVYRGKFLGD